MEVEAVRMDNGRGFTGKHVIEIYNHRRIRREYTAPDLPQFHGVSERRRDIIQKVTSSARAQAPVLYPDVEIPTSRGFGRERCYDQCESVTT